MDLLGRAEISFDFDWFRPADMLTNAPKLRWVQGTSSGLAGYVQRLVNDNGEVVFTTAAGTHAIPLAEFALVGALYFVKGIAHLQEQQRQHRWQRYATQSLCGKRVTVVGLGEVGRQTAITFATLGATVTGLARPGGSRPTLASVTVLDTDSIDAVLPITDILVLATPITPATTGLMTRDRLGVLPDGAVLVNICRGDVVDHEALADILMGGLPDGGRLGGVALDVTSPEPLPADSRLWDSADVLISPHSASTLATENELLVDLFLDNLGRWRDGRPLRNVYERTRGY
jgi:phosphoglycerate dehydrogenase-like enzyme